MSGDLLTPLWRTGTSLAPLLPQSMPSWSLLIGQARQARLLARLAVHLSEHLAEQGGLAAIPQAPRRYFEGALAAAERQHHLAQWELDRLRAALAEVPGPIVLLKGAAYVAAGLPPARGRLFTDIDFMVPREQLPAVEASLIAGGWVHQPLDPYDERYYRDWMHELPPFKHVWRHTWLDVHHTITPPTSRYAVNATLLLAAATPLPDTRPGLGGLSVLAPCDIVLHSAAHLLLDGEMPHGLRDLLDLNDLVCHFGADPAFWQKLSERAHSLGLGPLLALALAQLERLFGTTPPAEVRSAYAGLDRGLAAGLLPRLLAAALVPPHPSCEGRYTRLARLAWYLRSHALRMPPLQIAAHLSRKAWMRSRARFDRPTDPSAPA